jgi:hypothetical protein
LPASIRDSEPAIVVKPGTVVILDLPLWGDNISKIISKPGCIAWARGIAKADCTGRPA